VLFYRSPIFPARQTVGGRVNWITRNLPKEFAMTEKEWLEGSDPEPMLEFLRGKASDRKLRLFAVACSRRIWPLIDGLGRTAVELAENFADGLAGPEELRAARLACQGAGGHAAWYAAATNSAIAARNAARSAQAGIANNALHGSLPDELFAQAKLVREIFGDHVRKISVDSAWLTASVVKLARKIYDERAFDEIPRLAEELEKLGCANQELLDHCRGPGPHVRGCWVVDLVLGKE
jgi:hypothetical protein